MSPNPVYLTRQVLVAFQALLGTEDVAVSIDATHYCVKSRAAILTAGEGRCMGVNIPRNAHVA
jgi:GTP cyclohydrolase I